MSANAIQPLLTPAGQHLLHSTALENPQYNADQQLALATKLRKQGHEPELVSAVLTQLRLREKAREKFGEFANNMYFTQAGLEQATRLTVAGLHADRFKQAGITHVADLGCGIGSDAMALAALGVSVTAIEKDETTAAVALLNLMPWKHATVVHDDATNYPLKGHQGAWLDPARRTDNTSSSKRVFDPEAFSPPLSFVAKLADELPAVGAKLGPGIPHEAIPPNAEAQWVSVDGAVVEAGLWFGTTARKEIGRSALVIRHGTAHELSAPKATPPVETGPLEEYLYEPDGAVIRSGLLGLLAEKSDHAHVLHPNIAYLTSHKQHETFFAQGFKVLDCFPFKLKTLKKYLAERNIGTLTIKKRGADVSPEELRSLLKLKGNNTATIVVTRIAGKHMVIVVDPL